MNGSADIILTVGDYLRGGFQIRSYCSTGEGHSHLVDLQAMAAERGLDTAIDYDFKRSLICPECGAAGGGLEIRKNADGGARTQSSV